MSCKSTVFNREPDEVNENASATGLYPVAKNEHERNAPPTETPATRMPKTHWAWAETSGHFDWMDWHTPSVQLGVTDFDL